ISPAPQQVFPQQVAPEMQSVSGPQGGAWQVPLPQNGVVPSQVFPHTPQLCGSFCGLAQPPLQRGPPTVHSAAQPFVPPAPAVPPPPALPPAPAFPLVPAPPPAPAL